MLYGSVYSVRMAQPNIVAIGYLETLRAIIVLRFKLHLEGVLVQSDRPIPTKLTYIRYDVLQYLIQRGRHWCQMFSICERLPIVRL